MADGLSIPPPIAAPSAESDAQKCIIYQSDMSLRYRGAQSTERRGIFRPAGSLIIEFAIRVSGVTYSQKIGRNCRGNKRSGEVCRRCSSPRNIWAHAQLGDRK